jgi:hypothetical protein
MPHVRRAVPAALLAALALVSGTLAGCEGDEAPSPAASSTAPSDPSTPLASFPTTDLTVARQAFCPRVDREALVDALGADPASASAYRNGDRTAVTGKVSDVAHEYACTWRAADGTTARAWVFAPPVTARQASALRTDSVGSGCRPVAGAPAFGRRSVTARCVSRGRTSVALHGLFGDAWLSCSLELPRAADRAGLVDRAGRWCVTVATAASAG